MAGELSVICRRCGSPNAPGDQFCGSCGAFLEWEGEAAGGGAPPAAGSTATGLDAAGKPSLPPPAEARGAAPPTGPVAAGPVPPTAGPASLAGPASAAAPAAAPGPGQNQVSCPACRTVNPPTRTFCQSCGTRLPTQAPAGAPPSAASPGITQPSAAGTARRPGGEATKVRPESPAGGGGIPGWVLVIGALGILVGVVAVIAVTLLGSGELPSDATAAPPTPVGSAASPVPTDAPATTAASGDAEPTPVTEAEPVPLDGATASSVIGGREKFAPDKAIDGDVTTCWQEGSTTEKGEWIEVSFQPATVEAVVVYNGYQLSVDAYGANRRLRDILVSVDDGAPVAFRLDDTPDPQRLELGPAEGATTVRIEIVTTYDPAKTDYPGSPFDDTALSEIEVIGLAAP